MEETAYLARSRMGATAKDKSRMGLELLSGAPGAGLPSGGLSVLPAGGEKTPCSRGLPSAGSCGLLRWRVVQDASVIDESTIVRIEDRAQSDLIPIALAAEASESGTLVLPLSRRSIRGGMAVTCKNKIRAFWNRFKSNLKTNRYPVVLGEAGSARRAAEVERMTRKQTPPIDIR